MVIQDPTPGDAVLTATSGGGAVWISNRTNTIPDYIHYNGNANTTMSPPPPPPKPLPFDGYAYVDKATQAKSFRAAQVADKAVDNEKLAKWIGGAVYDAGLRVPTLEGVEVAFSGDWVVRDEAGVVYIYADEDFINEFIAD